MKYYEKTIKYRMKIIYLSWNLNIIDYESKAYDLLGIQYYNKPDVTLEKIIHDKMVK